MIRGFEFRLNRDTGEMNVDEQTIKDVDRFVVEDTDTPHSVDVDDRFVVTTFSRPVEAKVLDGMEERRVVVSEK